MVIVEHDKHLGIITERHYAHDVFLKGRSPPQTTVAEIVERDVGCVRPSQSVDVMGTKKLKLPSQVPSSPVGGIATGSCQFRKVALRSIRGAFG